MQQVAQINFSMFAVTCALSERVVGLEPVVRRLINAQDPTALATKLQKCKARLYVNSEMAHSTCLCMLPLLRQSLPPPRPSLSFNPVL